MSDDLSNLKGFLRGLTRPHAVTCACVPCTGLAAIESLEARAEKAEQELADVKSGAYLKGRILETEQWRDSYAHMALKADGLAKKLEKAEQRVAELEAVVWAMMPLAEVGTTYETAHVLSRARAALRATPPTGSDDGNPA